MGRDGNRADREEGNLGGTNSDRADHEQNHAQASGGQVHGTRANGSTGAERRLIVGVLGGMGPEATLDFFARILAATTAERDQDHLHLLIDNNPQVPNRNDAVAGTGPSPAPVLAEMAARLADAGAELLVMPCNAAHAFAGAITSATDVPFVNIVAETAAAAMRRLPRLERVGVLAAAGAHDAGLYRDAFAAHGVRVLHPEGALRERFMALLYRIKRGHKSADVRDEMADLAAALVDAGAEMIIAGCTEVPLVLTDADVGVPLLNSTDVLVGATIAYASGARRVEERPR